MEEKMTITITNDEGKEEQYEVLFTFESDETNRSYIVYTDGKKDKSGNIKVFASIYDPNDEASPLIPIETDEEWNIIEAILDEFQDKTEEE